MHAAPGRSDNPHDGSRSTAGSAPRGRATATAIGIALILGALGGAIVGYALQGPSPAPSGPSAAYLYLTIGFDLVTGLDQYQPANFTVPSHTLVLVTITNYDDAANPVDNASARVRGTLGNVETMRSASDAVGMAMAAIPATQVAHTFTLDQAGYALNVPVPAAMSRANPMIVTFRAYFNVTGSFVWHCNAPCDASSMATPGFMRGTITVADG